MNRLQTEYERIVTEYVTKFCDKQEMDWNGWVGSMVGDIAECSDFYFNLRDIIWDINSDQPKGLIIEWYYANIETPEMATNYYSYTKLTRA